MTQSSSSEAGYSLDECVKHLPSQYAVLECVSIGGMGAIYKAENRYTKRKCAIKVMRPDLMGDTDKLLRFRVEAEAASKLSHPNICAVFDFGITSDNMPYLVIDWIEGITLQKKVAVDGGLPTEEAESIFLQILSALSHAHERKIVHRDLKPDNIMLTRNPQTGRTDVHIVDFGIAKVLDENQTLMAGDGLTKTGTVIGTPMYMSPEQAGGKDIDPRSDIYSFGCLMYFVLTGSPPFPGDSFVDVLYKHLYADPPEIDPKFKVPQDLRNIALKALQKKPRDRYASAEAMAADLRKRSTGATVEIKASALPSQRKQQIKRVLAVLSFVCGFAIMYAVSIGVQNLMDKVAPEQHTSSPSKTSAK